VCQIKFTSVSDLILGWHRTEYEEILEAEYVISVAYCKLVLSQH